MIRRLLKAVRKMPRPPRSPGYRPLTKSCEGLTGACARLPLARPEAQGNGTRLSWPETEGETRGAGAILVSVC